MRGVRLSKDKISSRRALFTVTSAAAALVLVAGAADASIPGADGLITGCYSQATGSLRVINTQSVATCKSNERKLTWNQTGQQGPRGLPGFDGANGKTVLNGSGAPADTLGNDGDFYLDTTSDVLYGPKTAGAWPAPGSAWSGRKARPVPPAPRDRRDPQGTPGPRARRGRKDLQARATVTSPASPTRSPRRTRP